MSDAMKQRARDALRELPDIRAPLPMAYGDPAFQTCLRECADTPEMVSAFDRLYGANLITRQEPLAAMIDKATGKQDSDIRAFAEFVHDAVYLRLPSEAIHALRLTSQSSTPLDGGKGRALTP